MQLGDGNVLKDFVLLDILVRKDVYTHVDALVGVIATGEVRLWKHSQDHLRFLHCDFMHEITKKARITGLHDGNSFMKREVYCIFHSA
jgi:hypothetical protein